MAKLLNKNWTREELLKHVGDISQIADVQLSEISDGPGRGVRLAEFKTGTGLSFTVLIDRGLDIYEANYKGIPIAFYSPVGIKHPAYYEPTGTGWLRNFQGGWLSICGLTNVGLPGKDEWGDYEFHGRASNLPAKLISCGGKWLGDDYEMWLEGSIQEVSFFGFNLRLTRRLSTLLGENRLQIVDTVQNLGNQKTPFMLLYHCNFGFPLITEGSTLFLNQKSVTPRDNVAAKGIENHLTMDAPTPNYSEQVFFHDCHAAEDGFVTAAIINEELSLASTVSYRKAELPNLIQWKQMGSKLYVLGLEPANCLVMGREAERKRGTLQFLEEGETRQAVLVLGVEEGKESIHHLKNRITSNEPLNLARE